MNFICYALIANGLVAATRKVIDEVKKNHSKDNEKVGH